MIEIVRFTENPRGFGEYHMRYPHSLRDETLRSFNLSWFVSSYETYENIRVNRAHVWLGYGARLLVSALGAFAALACSGTPRGGCLQTCIGLHVGRSRVLRLLPIRGRRRDRCQACGESRLEP